MLSGLFLGLVPAIALVAPGVLGADPPAREIHFNRDIRPILSENCFACHGPDRNTRKAKLRLDVAEDAYLEHKSGRPLVPGRPDQSEVLKRITALDPEEAMPPAKAGKHLSQRQVELLREWVLQGAKYEGHWAFIPPVRSALPTVRTAAPGPVHPLDAFILSRLEPEGLTLSAEADRRTLLRRLSFDLTGLPPSPSALKDFAASRDPAAYEHWVERYLASPRHGERMAAHWLDLVRYADTVGYHGDCDYSVWPYRDYVIRSFNENLAYDQFTREQLAGDLLPGATPLQRVASGYQRLLRISTEGGVQDKEYLAKYAADRVRTTAAIWMGATFGCAECHDHKYDPYSTRDFYRFAAFFADVKEKGFYDKGYSENDWGPRMTWPTPRQQRELEDLDREIARARAALKNVPEASLQASRARWERRVQALDHAGLLGWTNLVPGRVESSGGAQFKIDTNGVVLVHGPLAADEDYTVTFKPLLDRVTGLRLEVLKDSSLPGNELARAGQTFVLAEVEIGVRRHPGARWQRVVVREASTAFAFEGFPIGATLDGRLDTGWAQGGGPARDHRVAFAFAQPVRCGTNATFRVRLRHSPNHPRQHIGKFRISLTSLERPAPDKLGLPEDVAKAVRMPAAQRTNDQNQVIAKYHRSVAPELARRQARLARLVAQREVLVGKIPTMLVTQATEPRTMRVLPRGNWMNDSGEIVLPGVPQFLQPLETKPGRATRLDLANWLTAPENPLTARVFVNRLWKMFFGTGLSKTLDDLGAQGEWPTHPELLDWLACEFMRPTPTPAETRAGLLPHAWDVRHLIRLIVTSRAYRQSSLAAPALVERDPFNRLLARQARFRLDAEAVRDNALAASGLLVERLGGPSAKPYQPEGFYAALNFPRREYAPDQGENLYRRSLYTHWQRTFLHPSLQAFDAAPREECTVNRVNSNTPLQALVLLNDPIYVEAARVLAANALHQAGRGFESRLDWLFVRALSREPRADERAALRELLGRQLRRYELDQAAARALTSVGDHPVAHDLRVAEWAAWTSVARAILNLHETITRN